MPGQELTKKPQDSKNVLIKMASLLVSQQKFSFQVKVTPLNKNTIQGNDEHNAKQPLVGVRYDFEKEADYQQFVAIFSHWPNFSKFTHAEKVQSKYYLVVKPEVIVAYFTEKNRANNRAATESASAPVAAPASNVLAEDLSLLTSKKTQIIREYEEQLAVFINASASVSGLETDIVTETQTLEERIQQIKAIDIDQIKYNKELQEYKARNKVAAEVREITVVNFALSAAPAKVIADLEAFKKEFRTFLSGFKRGLKERLEVNATPLEKVKLEIAAYEQVIKDFAAYQDKINAEVKRLTDRVGEFRSIHALADKTLGDKQNLLESTIKEVEHEDYVYYNPPAPVPVNDKPGSPKAVSPALIAGDITPSAVAQIDNFKPLPSATAAGDVNTPSVVLTAKPRFPEAASSAAIAPDVTPRSVASIDNSSPLASAVNAGQPPAGQNAQPKSPKPSVSSLAGLFAGSPQPAGVIKKNALDEKSIITLHEELKKLTKDYLDYLNTCDATSVATKHGHVTQLNNCLLDPNQSKMDSIERFYKQLETSEKALKVHRNPDWKRYVKTAVITGGILLSGIILGLAALAVYMTINNRTFGSLWKPEGAQFVEKSQEHNLVRTI